MTLTGFTDRSAKKPQSQSQPPTAAELMLQIEGKKAEILTAQKRQWQLVDRTTYDSAADLEYTELLGKIAALNADIDRLQSAIAKLAHTAKAAAVSESGAARQAKAAVFEQHAQRSLELVHEIADSLAAATKAVAAFYRECREMSASAPAGISLPMDTAAFDFLINGTTIQSFTERSSERDVLTIFNRPANRHRRFHPSNPLSSELSRS
jgi:predicted RNase H-like nuclease (RuvC/YqgF family)